jgi:hypothetical protein
MTPGFQYTETGTWLSDLPDELVASIGQDPDPGAGFSFVVRADPVDVHVIGPGGEGPLEITATVAFSGDALSAIRARPHRFFVETRAVLAGAPGFHRLTDGEGNDADPDAFAAVALHHYIYPDGASKHAVLTGVIDLVAAAGHLHDAGERFGDASSGEL